MKGRSKRSRRKICDPTQEFICFAEFAPGTTPSTLLDGPQMLLFGQEVAPASPSQVPASVAPSPTSGTSGRKCSGSSESADLQSSLSSRLAQLLDTDGSMEYLLKWKTKATPAGRPYCQLVASARHISGPGSSGWPTCTAKDAANARNRTANRSEGGQHHDGLTLVDAVEGLAGWATPNCSPGEALETWEERRESQKAGNPLLGDLHCPLHIQAQLAGWATPRAQEDGCSVEATIERQARARAKYEAGDYPKGCGPPSMNSLNHQAQLAGWPTPVANDDNKTPEGHLAMKLRMGQRDGTGACREAITSLQVMVQTTLAGCSTPRATDGSNGGPNQAGGALPAAGAMAGGGPPRAPTRSRRICTWTVCGSRGLMIRSWITCCRSPRRGVSGPPPTGGVSVPLFVSPR